MFEFPAHKPESSPSDLWRIQNEILHLAESLLGPRDQSKKIYQPVFKDNGPYLINTPTKDGAFIALSKNARAYWPTVAYELAHETVHLLNPIEGYTNWLEEGVAVAFAVHVSKTMTRHPMAPPNGDLYDQALKLVQQLSNPCFEDAARIRRAIGALSCATEANLTTLFPDHTSDLLKRLSTRCQPRSL